METPNSTEKYYIETLRDGFWESDTIGDNEPRSMAECLADVKAFRAGLCGADFQKLFRQRSTWRIVEETSVEVSHAV